MRYAFVTSGGIEYEREIEVLPKEFEQFNTGQPIEIVYDPVNPEVNMLKSAVSAAREAVRSRHASQRIEPLRFDRQPLMTQHESIASAMLPIWALRID